jgi:hypothetical protein
MIAVARRSHANLDSGKMVVHVTPVLLIVRNAMKKGIVKSALLLS